jgi:hypothetical protein
VSADSHTKHYIHHPHPSPAASQPQGFSLPATPLPENQEPADAKIGENLSLIVNLLSDHFF